MDQQRFISLLVKEQSDFLTTSEKQELSDLLLQDKELQTEYRLFKQYWSRKQSHAFHDEKSFQKVLHKIDLIEGQGTINPPIRSSFYKKYVSIAASFLILSCSAFWFYSHRQKRPQEVATDTKLRSVILADGSSIILNAASKLTYSQDFSQENREVTLVGEGFFDIKTDQEHPFIIHTEQATIRVLGTTFNLKAYPSESKTETSLLSGSLEVVLKNSDRRRVILKPKQKLTITKNQDTRVKKTLAPLLKLDRIAYTSPKNDNAMETLWLENKLAFQDESFENIARELERRYGVQVFFENEEVKSLRFNAVFKQENIDQILNALKIAAPFSYHIQGNTITIND